MKYILFGNGGSGNHGCEAIVRGTKNLLGGNPRIHSAAPEEDEKYGLGEMAEIVPAIQRERRNIRFIKAYLKMRLTGNYVDLDLVEYISTIHQAKGKATVALSVGGDNYCYKGTEIYRYLNQEYKKHGFKTVLWGCSVEPEIVKESETAKDMRKYDLIVARESITYQAMKEVGANVVLGPDPAFFMEPKTCKMDEMLCNANVIGINMSPLILNCAKDRKVAYENYLELIKYILKETDATIALIPHVVWSDNDDREVLYKLYEDIGKNNRVVLVEDHTAPELKYIISHCKIFVGARTHATIAAYSSCVPTLVVGYSVKARGIAKDIFGTEEKYVLPVQELQDTKTLVETFKWFEENYTGIQQRLEETMPQYVARGLQAKEKVLSLF